MSVPEIARRLEDRFALLRGGARDAPPRHQTLHAVVDWSWNLLEPAGLAAMRALSVFPGGYTAHAAQHLLGDGDAVAVLEDLADQSLLTVTDTPSGTRCSMLETVREFSTAHREAAGETDRVLAGFLAWARDFGVAHHEAPFGPDPYPAGERIHAEQDNLLLALRHGLDRGDGATVAATSAVLGALWMVESDANRLATLVQEPARVLSHYRLEPDLVEATRTASTLCTAYTSALHGPRALRSLVTLRRLPQAPPSTVIRALATVLRATPDVLGSDRTALEQLCGSPEPLLAGVANGVASHVWEHDEDPDRAVAAAERMAVAFDDQALPWARVLAHSRVAELRMRAGQGDRALRHAAAALRALEGADEPSDVLQLQWVMALASLQVGAVDAPSAGRSDRRGAGPTRRTTWSPSTSSCGRRSRSPGARSTPGCGGGDSRRPPHAPRKPLRGSAWAWSRGSWRSRPSP